MKKIPTLFNRVYDEKGRVTGITPEVKEGFEWVLNGEGIATLKIDGSCCAVIDGEYYKRYDAKKGRKIPEGAIPCQPEPDEITGHFPHWVKLDPDNPADKWFFNAFMRLSFYCNGQENCEMEEGTYEAIGKHFQGNPYGLEYDTLYRHGSKVLEDFPRDFEGMKEYLATHEIEGVVFWKDGEPKCKIKRSDFGYSWNGR